MGKQLVKRQFRRPRTRWEDNIKMDFRELGREEGRWMDVARGSKVLIMQSS
jgi:hypothetical protein